MDKRLLQALISVSSTSAEAKRLADQLLSESSADIIKQLHEKIAQLESQLQTLAIMALPETEELSDDETHFIIKNFSIKLHASDETYIRQFDRKYLKYYPSPLRLVLATVLRNRAIELKVPPLDIWSDIIALGGELK